MRIGLLGGGQLARMLMLAGYPLGLRFKVFDPTPSACARELAPTTTASYEDDQALERFLEDLDVVTYEFENIPEHCLEKVGSKVSLQPNVEALYTAQDRLYEKQLFERLDIPTPRYLNIENEDEIASACQTIGFPCIVKTRRLGYDGKGQQLVRSEQDLDKVYQTIAGKSAIVEELVSFSREFSIVAATDQKGQSIYYKLTENIHQDGILRLSYAPSRHATAELQKQAESYVKKIIDEFRYVGVIALEMFYFDGELVANEIAPRVHNSGHWTIDGARTSQFENHLRAVAGLPLGSTEIIGYNAMVNVIGEPLPFKYCLRLPGAKLHRYDKTPRPQRKLGHINFCAESLEKLENQLAALPGSTLFPH